MLQNCTRSRVTRNLLSTLMLLVLAAVPALAQDGTVTGTVTHEDSGQPFSGAVVLLVETAQEATTGSDGSYTFQVPPGIYTVLVTALGHGASEQRVTVVAGDTATADFTLAPSLSQFGEEVVVVGSRARRTAVATPVPVDVLSSEDIATSSQPETAKMIQFLAPSFNESTSTISDGTDIVRPSTLRSLGPDQTLVLVNGRRRHNSALVHVNGSIGRGTAGVDLNAIPASAIERVEILRDGASAQYGSDAIAGVINLVLKSSVDKTRVDVMAGEYYEGDGETLLVSANRGWRIKDRGFFNVTVEYRDRGYTNRAGEDPRRIFNFQEQQLFQPALSEGTPDPREATYDRLNHRYGDAESQNLHLFLNSEIPISDSLDFYLFGGYSDREGKSGGFNRLPNQNRTDIFLFPEGHLPFINTDVVDSSLAFGLRKRFGSWSLDSSLTYGSNEFDFFISNSANTSLGPASPTSADAGRLSFTQAAFNLDFFGTAHWGSLPVNVAVGLEARQDRYEIRAGDPVSYIDGGFPDQFGGRAPAGIQVFPGFRPSNEVDEDRTNIGVYGDIEFNPTSKLLVGLAARFEDYSDFGNNFSGKLALRYEVTPRFALRGSTSTGFRAPSLHQSYFNNTSTQFVLVDGALAPLEVGTFRNDSAVVEAFGVPRLKEETSLSYSVGFTARPTPNLSITADAFKIDIDDRIVISGQFRDSNPQIAPILAPFGVSAAQFFTNAIDTETEGLDLVVAWYRSLGGRRALSLTAAANWNETQVVGDVRTPAALTGFGETLFDRIERNYIERGQPREHYNFSARYDQGGFSVLARLNKFGAVVTVESAGNPSIDQTFSSKWLADLDLSYKFRNGLRLAVGANNLFDEYPDKNRDEISFNGIFVYPRRTAPFGFNGGFYYARASFEF